MRQWSTLTFVLLGLCAFCLGGRSSESSSEKAQRTIDNFCRFRSGGRDKCLKEAERRCSSRRNGRLCRALDTLNLAEISEAKSAESDESLERPARRLDDGGSDSKSESAEMNSQEADKVIDNYCRRTRTSKNQCQNQIKRLCKNRKESEICQAMELQNEKVARKASKEDSSKENQKEKAEETVSQFCENKRMNRKDCLTAIGQKCNDRSRGKLCEAHRILVSQESTENSTPKPKEPNSTEKPDTTEGKVQKADKAQISRLNSRFNEIAAKRRSLVAISPSQIPTRNKNARLQHTELSVNEDGDYFFGDLELSQSQAARIEEELNKQSGGRQKRKVGKAPIFLLWNKLPISYQFAPGLPQSAKNVIRSAIQLWEENTCVRWEENGKSKDKIEFYNGPGCSSYVGRTGGIQEISVATPGCASIGVVAHEIGHSLGFFHEQARPDQLSNVNIVYNNISPLRWNNFVPQEKSEVNDYKLPYDFGSVMHYDGFSFAMNKQKATIATLEPKFQETIGQRNGPSFIDFAQVNEAYCSGMCSNKLDCKHDSYPNPNSCSDCKCPSGFGGLQCETVEYTKCGAEITATSSKQTLKSPNYPRNFKIRDECSWLIKTDSSHKVFLQFTGNFDLDCKTTCDESFVEVKVGPDFRTTGYRFCCGERPTEILKSAGNEMMIMFRGNGPVSKGFSAQYWTDTPSSKTTVDPRPTPVRPTTPRPRPVTKHPTPRPVTKRPGPKTTVKPAPGKPTPKPGKNECEYPCDQWSKWSGSCSQNCGGCGKIIRTRKCHLPNPRPEFVGPKCYDVEKKKCNMSRCKRKGGIMARNGEWHLLFDGCCWGLVPRSGNRCLPFWDAIRADFKMPPLPEHQTILRRFNSVMNEPCNAQSCGDNRKRTRKNN